MASQFATIIRRKVLCRLAAAYRLARERPGRTGSSLLTVTSRNEDRIGCFGDGNMLLMMIHQTKAIAGSDGNVDAVTSLTLDA